MLIKQALYPLFYGLSMPFSLASLIQKTGQSLLLPVYHTVSNRPLPHIQHLYQLKNVAQFERDIDYLLKHFKPISNADIHEYSVENQTIATPSFHLSFDDGMRDCYEIIAPILKKKGVSATFFINPAFVDNQQLFYRHQISVLIHQLKSGSVFKAQQSAAIALLKDVNLFKKNLIHSLYQLTYHHQKILQQVAFLLGVNFKDYLKTERPYMTKSEILALQKDGFTIGAHSLDHPRYADIEFDERVRQTLESVRFITKNFPSSHKIFAFPYFSADISLAFFEKIKNQVDLTYGTSGLKMDVVDQHLHRFPMEGLALSPKIMVKGEYFLYLLKKKLGRNIVTRI